MTRLILFACLTSFHLVTPPPPPHTHTHTHTHSLTHPPVNFQLAEMLDEAAQNYTRVAEYLRQIGRSCVVFVCVGSCPPRVHAPSYCDLSMCVRVWWVRLSAVADPRHVVACVCRAVHLIKKRNPSYMCSPCALDLRRGDFTWQMHVRCTFMDQMSRAVDESLPVCHRRVRRRRLRR
jgi:hypothetical protein